MFKFPWKIHAVRKWTASDHLVEVEHRHLLELYERGLDKVCLELSVTPAPLHSDSPHFTYVSNLKHDRDHYMEAIEWLKGLKG